MAYQPSPYNAFEKTTDAREALKKGADVLKQTQPRSDAERRQLLFCASCLLDLDSGLSEAIVPQGAKAGVGKACG